MGWNTEKGYYDLHIPRKGNKIGLASQAFNNATDIIEAIRMAQEAKYELVLQQDNEKADLELMEDKVERLATPKEKEDRTKDEDGR